MLTKIKRAYLAADFDSTLTYQNIFWLFMAGNLLGVLLEGIWCKIRLGHWETHVVTVWGPFCLIYGLGAVLLYIGNTKFKSKNLFLKFALLCLLADAAEYFCGWLLKVALGMKAWDYSNCFMNLHGLITLEMTLLWGVAGIIFGYLLMPALTKAFKKMQTAKWRIAAICLSVFMVINILLTAVCMVRWSGRHHGMPPKNRLEAAVDTVYNDAFMESRFCEWQFIA